MSDSHKTEEVCLHGCAVMITFNCALSMRIVGIVKFSIQQAIHFVFHTFLVLRGFVFCFRDENAMSAVDIDTERVFN